jgi:pimeloyl-ACP methyl ester carboxylesterase
MLEENNRYLRPLQAHDWDVASLLQFQSFGFDAPPLHGLKALNIPVLIIQGENDNIVPPKVARRLKEVRDIILFSLVFHSIFCVICCFWSYNISILGNIFLSVNL